MRERDVRALSGDVVATEQEAFVTEPRRVLVTGAGGFIGSHLVERCVELGWSVRALVHYRSDGGRGWLAEARGASAVEVVAGDVRDADSLRRACAGVDTVFHLAALVGVPYSFDSPLAYVRTNVEGTCNLLEASRAAGVTNIILTSTSETYGTAESAAIAERHPATAHSPYAASKIAADQLALSLFRAHALPVKIARPFNAYGPRQSPRAIVPNTIAQILAGRRVLELGNVEPRRDFTYVEDIADGFVAVARCDAAIGEALNLGTGEDVRIGDLARRIGALMGVEVEIARDERRVRREAAEVDRLVCDAARARSLCGWAPRVALDAGLARTIEWARAHRAMLGAGEYAV